MGQSVEISTTRLPLRADEDRSSLSTLCHSPDYFPLQCRLVYLCMCAQCRCCRKRICGFMAASSRIQGDEGACNRCAWWKPFVTGLLIWRWKTPLKKLLVSIRIHNYIFNILAHERNIILWAQYVQRIFVLQTIRQRARRVCRAECLTLMIPRKYEVGRELNLLTTRVCNLKVQNQCSS
jgi:hypothetical protein